MKVVLSGDVKMKMSNFFKVFILFIIFCLLCGCASKKNTVNIVSQEYSNPIDSYFLPRIENAEDNASRKELQDIYMCVWSTEFDNVILWMQDKCVYQEDKDNLLLYKESVNSLIEITCTVLQTDWADTYTQAPGDKGSGGLGTQSRLRQTKGEIYRDACTKLIDDTYIFIERDYSLERYQ